jgi:predicted transcriptional regulator
MTGCAQKTICWLLMEEGNLTAPAILAMSEIPPTSLSNSILHLFRNGFVQREKQRQIGARSLYHYGLTRKGIEMALHIEWADVKDYLLEGNRDE